MQKRNKDFSNFTFDMFLDLCPVEYEDLDNYLDEDVIFQFLLDLDFIHKGIKEGKINKNEIFILISQDFTISIKKFLQSYNKTLGIGMPLQFLLNHKLETYPGRHVCHSFIIAPRTHINYFKLVNEVRNISIDTIDDSLLEEHGKFGAYKGFDYLLRQVDYLQQKKSIKLFQTLTY